MIVSGSETRLSKANVALDAEAALFPLQTRACLLPNARVDSLEETGAVVDSLLRKGYNTLVVPMLMEGCNLVRTRGDGRINRRHCPGAALLGELAKRDVATWLLVDFLTAGVGDELGTFARRHTNWMARNAAGGRRIPGVDGPGMMDWSNLEFRRFIANMLVSILDAYPIEGVVVDLRQIPESSDDPATWSHLSFDALARIRNELGIELEGFLERPTIAEFDTVIKWRRAELERFIDSLMTQGRSARRDITAIALVEPEARASARTIWVAPVAQGVLGEVALPIEAGTLAERLRDLDRLVGDRRPVLATVDTEEMLPAVCAEIQAAPVTGFLTLEPGETVVDMPVARMEWHSREALESDPMAAAHTILRNLKTVLDPGDPANIYFEELDEFLTAGAEDFTFREAMKVREDVKKISDLLAEEEDAGEKRSELLRELDLVARLLVLTPSPTEYL